jgi:hypothetical protein
MNDPKESPGGEPGDLLATVGKAVLTVVLGIVALITLALTVCGLLLPAGSRGPAVVGSLILTALLVAAIVWLWR